jgi:hypothetical protein
MLQFTSTKQYKSGEWVRPTRGLYAGDLALVFYPTINGKPWPPRIKTQPEYLTIALMPQWDPTTSTSESKGKQKRGEQPPARAIVDLNPIKPHKFIGCTKFQPAGWSEVMYFYYQLLVTSVNADDLRQDTPKSVKELQSFADTHLDVQIWRQYLTQETLRSDEEVCVVGGEFNNCVGVIKSIDIPTMSATLIFSTSGGNTNTGKGDEGTLEAAVPIRTLEWHFRIGNNVCWALAGGEERFGMVVEIMDWVS